MTETERPVSIDSAEGLPTDGAMASLDLLYESEDARFALFEVFDGHLAAVDTSKLA